MRPRPPSIDVLCPHLSEAPARGRLGRRRSRGGTALTIDSGRSPIDVHLCPDCSLRLGASTGDRRALELAALTLVHQELHERLSDLVSGLRELLPLLGSAPPGKSD